MNTDVDFALRMIGEQTLQIRLLNMALEQSKKELTDLKKELADLTDDKKKPDNPKGVQAPKP